MSQYDYQITDILRGVSTNYNHNYSSQTSENSIDTSIWNAADEKAASEENKTAVTVLLEDFAELTNSFSNNRSCINEKDTKKCGFIAKLLGSSKTDNVFKTDEAANSIKENGSFTQADIFQQEVAQNGGVKYAESGDDIYEAALNFAKADIAAIEKAYNNSHVENAGKSKKLDYAEINTYAVDSKYGSLAETLSDIDLDGKDKNISAEEYASYLIAVDGLISFGQNNDKADFSASSVDGLVSTQEVELAKGLDTEVIKAAAAKIYSEHYAK